MERVRGPGGADPPETQCDPYPDEDPGGSMDPPDTGNDQGDNTTPSDI